MSLTASDLFARIEALRVPVPPQAAAHDWKDWYHVVLLHQPSGWRVVANLNLVGGGVDAELQSTLLVHTPDGRLHGASRSQPWRAGMAQVRPLSIEGDDAAFAIDGRQLLLRLAPRGLDLNLELRAEPAATPLLVTEGAPFGSGFIGWGLVPGLALQGCVSACGTAAEIGSDWFGYHDHNFGRFRWGENFGWEWLVAHVPVEGAEAVTVVVDWRCDRHHASGGLPYLFVLVGGALRKVFLGPALRLRWHWHDATLLPVRLPGAMATLLADRPVRPPRALTLEAADERDRLSLSVDVDAYLEIIAPDNRSAAFTRIGEASGPAALELQLAEDTLAGCGLAYAEYTR